MLRMTLSLVPRGDERAARILGTIEIANDCTGDEQVGNYEAKVRGTLHRDVPVRGVDRVRGPWWLVLQVLKEVFGG